MIIVKIELHSAITHRVTELGRMVIANDGTATDAKKGNYDCAVARKGYQGSMGLLLCGNAPQKIVRQGRVENHPRLSKTVWYLVAKCLKSMGYE